jgi:formate hydrogenlyase subunit 3/multisubunit Na+/H+ antiporter MnhD subunit
MELFTSIAHAAAWVIGLLLLFAVIGFIATIRWIIGLFWQGERAVEAGVRNVGDSLRKR